MRINFQTARDVLTAFPTLADDMDARPDARDPITFTKDLARSATPEDALSFFSYLAPRREAVWWTCRCLQTLGAEGADALAAASAWVARPDEAERTAALGLAEEGDDELAATWAAYAAGWSGGNIGAPDGPPVLAAPHLTAKAVRACVLIAVASAPFDARAARLERCLDEALSVANDDAETHFD
ncbi:MAG: hypothetical protein AAF318_08645 [Pseudomonadota bacterium]